MALVNKITGEFWKPENVNAMSQYVRRLCSDELRKQDEQAGVPKSGQVYEKDESGKLIVNPELSKKRSTGRELRNLHSRRWELFCSQPQDEARCEALGFFKDPQSVAVQTTRLAEATAECPDELVNAVKIPGLDPDDDVDVNDDDVADNDDDANPTADAKPKSRRRYVGR